MKKNELMNSLEQLERDRGIDRETLLEAIEESLLTAARKAAVASREVSVKVKCASRVQKIIWRIGT